MKLTRSPWSRLVTEKRPAVEAPEPAPPLLADDPEPIRYPAAFCAPGTETVAAITLLLHGVHAASIHASRMLEGSDRIVVVAGPPQFLPDPESHSIEPRDAGPDTLGFTWHEDMRFAMRTPQALPLSLTGVVSPCHSETLPDTGNRGCYSG